MLSSTNHQCFGCGRLNPIGLQLDFRLEGEVCRAQIIPRPEFQSYPGILHGGILTTMLDEAMGKHLNLEGIAGLTVNLEVRFKKAVPIGKPLTIESRKVSNRRNLYEMAALALLADGTVAGEAHGKFMAVDGDKLLGTAETIE